VYTVYIMWIHTYIHGHCTHTDMQFTYYLYLLTSVFCFGLLTVFDVKSRLVSSIPEGGCLIVTGIVVGLILSAAGQTGYILDATTFFLILLPWIVLNASYFLPFQSLFDHIAVVLMFAVIGTLWNIFSVGLILCLLGRIGAFVHLAPVHTLVFASALAAVDPVIALAVFGEVHVKERLLVVVLGQSLLNNGMAVVSNRVRM